jgi:hypothetical protein
MFNNDFFSDYFTTFSSLSLLYENILIYLEYKLVKERIRILSYLVDISVKKVYSNSIS